jgi:hypothetical protein
MSVFVLDIQILMICFSLLCTSYLQIQSEQVEIVMLFYLGPIYLSP